MLEKLGRRCNIKSDYNKRPISGYSKEYAKGYLRIFGVTCPRCKGTGFVLENDPELGAFFGAKVTCSRCGGIGKVKKS